MIKTNIIKVKGDWTEVLNDCRFTVGKFDLVKEPSEDFKKRVLIAEHSPIRDISFKWEWRNMMHWVVVHWVRHKWEKFVSTQRTDRTGINRHSLPQDCNSDMRGEANVQHLIDTERKRLCYQAAPETRESAESLKIAITERDKFIGDVLVPSCIYRCGCSEKSETNQCRYFEVFRKYFEKQKLEAPALDICNIQDRYDVYNKMFWERNKTI